MNDQERRKELAHFLRTRRERISPEAAGLPGRSRRRTPGLRREELAAIAGIGLTWYTGLEQGRAITVSTQVLESLARVLHLNDVERNHLFLLARQELPTEPYPCTTAVSPMLQHILDSMGTSPAYIANPRFDLLAWNQAMARVYQTNFGALPVRERNILRLTFTSPSRHILLADWEQAAQHLLALFRSSTERYVGEPLREELVAELEQASPQFRAWWSQHALQVTHTEKKELNHPLFGRLVLQPTTFQVTDAPDLRMVIYTPLPEADTPQKLALLGDSQVVQAIR
ncbi:XRE family transcriptional regulator [Ktedonosporobacter rubrisoli]|uniref:XRE family transcriptional regulator n=1 Tax=Ktedonosporobacter rubrisoli TaxID=2509675 RepID=A0A4V0YYE8_KTERU|nr:helix-turn-helix transcriptional regulator [Ktedonosporobacter rubrisoli]QBD75971.1 XRE family transcriptional regulator [Ktedonosporobacter rubrisoli]